MRSQYLIVGLLAVAMAGCASGGSQSPAGGSNRASPSPSAPTSTEPLVILGVRVHWDGAQCSYEGPMVIRAGTTTRFEYTFDEGLDAPLLVVAGARPGTTWEMVVEATQTYRASEVPPWAIVTGIATIQAGTSALYPVDSDIAGEAVGGYFVGCATAPISDGGTDVMYPAALLLISGP